ncbi:MAG: hypothetical protein KQH63_16960 [Desulfobulbaceae bacterium]|nr:hypothetical protein [Desulfobulbaceae bacterium]
MEDKKETAKPATAEVKETSKENATCVCNMEWRGIRGEEEGSDCICYPEEE